LEAPKPWKSSQNAVLYAKMGRAALLGRKLYFSEKLTKQDPPGRPKNKKKTLKTPPGDPPKTPLKKPLKKPEKGPHPRL